MNLFRGLMLATLGLAVTMTVVAADDDDKQTKKKRPERPQRAQGFGRFPGAELMPARLQEELGLSSEQKEKLAKLQKEFESKNKEAGAKQKEASDKFRAAMEKARQDKDRDAMRKAFEDFRAAGQGSFQLRTDFQKKVNELLDEKQQKKLQELRRGRFGARPQPQQRPAFGRPAGMSPFALQRLDLTKEQQEKIDNLRKEFEDKVKGVLTDEQKKKLEEGFGRGRRPERRRPRD